MRSRLAAIGSLSGSAREGDHGSFTLCFAADYSRGFAMIASF